MIIFWGTRLYGRVYRVPGRFYVATIFFHIYLLPLIPLKSWMVIEGSEKGGKWRGVPIKMNGLSVLAGYLRAVCAIGIVYGILIAIMMAIAAAQEPLNAFHVAFPVGLLTICSAAYAGTHKIAARATPEVAAEIVLQAGMAPAVAAEIAQQVSEAHTVDPAKLRGSAPTSPTAV